MHEGVVDGGDRQRGQRRRLNVPLRAGSTYVPMGALDSKNRIESKREVGSFEIGAQQGEQALRTSE